MSNFKIGDIVARKSYNYDVLFRIINIHPNGIVDLVGITSRILADAEEYDLKLITKQELEIRLSNIEKSRRSRLDRSFKNIKYKNNNYSNKFLRENTNYTIYQKEKTYKKPGTVVHIDGDEEYCAQCKELYKKMGIRAYIFNIEER